MAQYGPSIQTANITTGNMRTTLDLATATFGYATGGLRNPLGSAYYDNPTTLANPSGVGGKFRYVKYQSIANPAVVAAPAIVYWVDEFSTTVTAVLAESQTGEVNSVAGLLMVNSGDLPSLTAALLNGNYVWICVGGLVVAANTVAATAKGDSLLGAATNWVPARLASGTAPTSRPLGIAQTAIASGLADIKVTLES